MTLKKLKYAYQIIKFGKSGGFQFFMRKNLFPTKQQFYSFIFIPNPYKENYNFKLCYLKNR